MDRRGQTTLVKVRPPNHVRLYQLTPASLSAPLSAGGEKPSSSSITKHLLNTLSDSSNPITHSNIYERSDTVVSATTGHQRGEGRTPHGVSAKAYFEDRSRKLSIQRRDEFPKGVLGNVRVYIDGYLSGTTDIEIKRIIAQAGGTTLYVLQREAWLRDCPSPYQRILLQIGTEWRNTYRELTTAQWIQKPQIFDHKIEKLGPCSQTRMGD
ncbi:hypothetical protein JVT61DRAFT_12984 [Boletus reticuloceps]|uniref:BRCT domain-containing protein n=1 Tax=Boletus reticuloceps TaxID=495285 RepID=A0A8I2YY82_9AGAM|nr:hypothetical protein JVT61DRAFT_12984 [Boletus reticuloceps]